MNSKGYLDGSTSIKDPAMPNFPRYLALNYKYHYRVTIFSQAAFAVDSTSCY